MTLFGWEKTQNGHLTQNYESWKKSLRDTFVVFIEIYRIT